MAHCKLHRMCGLDALEGTGENLCILHSQKPDKDKMAFDEALTEHRGTKSNFMYFVFPGYMDFCGTTFLDKADFRDTKFAGEPHFNEAKFHRGADFRAAKFTEEADFSKAEFHGAAYFNWADFTKRAYFGWAEFTERADFSNVKFTGEAYFKGTKFRREADFREAKFHGAANFWGASFSGRTFFSFGKEDSGSAQNSSGVEVDFSHVIMEPLDVLSFRDVDLQRCRFLGTDLRKAEFANVAWPRKGGRFRVYDEDVELWEGETREWPHIEQTYRQLKQNYEDRRDYERASDFHYGEKEMRRKNPDTSWGLRLLLTLYWLVSGYGERWFRPLIWAAGLLVVCTALYLCLGLHLKNGGPALAWTSGWDWLESALYSFRVMTLLRPDDFVPGGLAAKFLKAIQSILGPIILGLFALAIRQKLKR